MAELRFQTKQILLHLAFVAILAVACSCSTEPVGKYSNQAEFIDVYLNDYKASVLEIVFERGHTAHRILVYHKDPFYQLQIFRDKQVYKELKIDDGKFRELLLRSLQTAGVLYRKPANKEVSPCRTPFVIAVKKGEEKFSVQGCRASDESTVFSKLISDIEHLATTSKF